MATDPKTPAKTMIGWLPNAKAPAPSGQASRDHAQQPAAYPQPEYAQQPASYGQEQAQGYPPGYGHNASPDPQGYPPAYGHSPSDPNAGYAQPPAGYGQSYQPPQSFSQPPGYGQAPSQPQPQPQGYPAGYAQAYPQTDYAPPGYAGYGQAAAAAISYPDRPDDPSLRNISATVGVSERVRFIRLTYLHLLGAIVVFAGLLYLLFTNQTLITKVSAPLVQFAFGGRWNWAIVLAVFMGVSWVADYWASHSTSRGMQYVGLGIYVVAEALLFVPLLALVVAATANIIARGGGDPHILRDAAITTLAIFGALTASVVISKKDFSWLRSGLVMAGTAATVLVFLSIGFGFNLGIVFSVAMVVLAAGYILYQTSQVLAHYDPRQHVAAALALFSSVALMFWYVIRIFLRMRQ